MDKMMAVQNPADKYELSFQLVYKNNNEYEDEEIRFDLNELSKLFEPYIGKDRAAQLAGITVSVVSKEE